MPTEPINRRYEYAIQKIVRALIRAEVILTELRQQGLEYTWYKDPRISYKIVRQRNRLLKTAKEAYAYLEAQGCEYEATITSLKPVLGLALHRLDPEYARTKDRQMNFF